MGITMIDRQLLRMLIKEILKEENTKLRTSKGFSASHPIISHKPFMMGLGKSDYYNEFDEKDEESKESVDVSKVFEADPLEDIEEYGNIIREILNAKELY